MHVGDQNFGVTKLELEFLTRHGVCHIDANRGLPKPLTLKAMIAHRAAAAEYGVSLEMIHVLPGRAVILGRDPERDVEIEEFKRKIEIAGRSGLRGLNYSFGTLENQRTPDKTGRGGATYSSLDWSEYDDSPVDDDRAGTTVDQIFERIRYFHERVVPVAEHWKVQLACHLDDPPAPSLRGVARWDFPVFEGCKRFVEMVDSPYNGLNFCCGTAAEGLTDPKSELIPIVKYFAERKKIFNIHFRNIVGGLRNFSEVWPDEGDVDMFELAETLYDAGYEYMLMPDHGPRHTDDPGSIDPIDGKPLTRVKQSWAYQFGYINSVIQAVKRSRGCAWDDVRIKLDPSAKAKQGWLVPKL